ncbi:hypothetical protein AAJ62_gp209 [Synechococcus phage ACG-2014g]|jgi:hypothetical protein|uniref:Uncharacterized protein n=1 Tax=Synechococcus phage ACG-2014g TaxID=1493512 RepID=A0A0E3HCN3_9CAUD|nr:hypothetical protein AAJ62_gp209 [Synechococcus phage ACG-2014g]AIX24553.1 hypothetical protein Syn7803US105_209 [Synechococcus phage ACG-2014g]
MTVYRFSKEETEEATAEQILQKNKEDGAAVIVATIFFFTKPLVLMLLWNMLMPGIFGLSSIGYLKSLGLYLFARIIIDKND